MDTPTSAPNIIEGTINWPTGMPLANPGGGQSYSAQKPDDIRPLGDLDGDGVVEIMRSVRTSTTTSRHFIVAFNADRSARSCFDLDLMLSESQGLLADTDALTAADFNNDGRADILVANRIFFADKVLPATSQCGAPPAGTFKEFSLASIGNACILTDGLTQFPFGAVRTLMPTDLNGDGLTDLALYTTGTVAGNSCPAGNGYGLYYWINTTPPAPVAGQMNTALSFGASNKLELQAFTNTGTTAGYEQIVSLSDLNGDAIPELLTSYPAGSGAKYDEYSYRRYNSATLSATAFTFGSATEIAQGAALNLLDVNGDGLSDLLYATTNEAACTSAWQLQENRGGTFVSVPLLASPSAELSEGIRVDRLGAEGACNRSTRNYWATQAQLMAPADLNADGRSELMIPSSFAERLCTAGVYYQEIGKPSLTPTTACAPVPDVSVAEGQGDNTSLADRATRTFFADANGTQPIGPVLSRALLDSSAYRFSTLNFAVLANGSYALSKVPLPATFTRQLSGGPSTAPYVPASLDFFGDGLTDLVSENGCRAPYIFSISQNPCFNPSGAQPSTIQVRMFFNNGAGARTNRAASTPELLSSVSDAYGKSIEWIYDALSSSGARTAALPLYALPARDGVGVDAPYIDAKHFYFSSSMQVVAEMFTRNGLGSIDNPGMNETRYGYEEAMYNQQGRGFQGFRKIVSEDHTVDNTDNSVLDAKFGLRNTTIFHQKFPLTGMVECEGTTPLGIALDNCSQVVNSSGTTLIPGSSTTLISGSKTDYQCVVTGAATEASFAACATWANRPSATYGFAFPKQTTGFQFDLNNQALMRTSSKTIDTIDQYGNVRAEISSNTSTFDGGATETRGMSVSRDYDNADTTNWWVNKLIKQTSTAAAVNATGTRVIDSTLNPARTSTMLYGYHANNRQVNCEAMIPGPASTSDCVNAPMASGAAAQIGLVERRTTNFAFDDYGNVTDVITQARGEPNRTLSSSYLSSAGYFPNSVTDALQAVTNSTFDNRFGKPNLIIDPNQLASSTTFDGMGREIGMVFPSAQVAGLTANAVPNQLAPPKRIAYEACTPLQCPTGTVLRVVSDQKGTPRQIAFMDALGRTLRSAKAAFNQTDSSGAVLSWDTVDTQYSTRGLSYQTTEPRQILNNFLASTGLISGGILTTLKYDQLGRVLNKVSTRVARNDAGGYGTGLLYRTEYSHVGFKTAIRVCGLALSEFTCPAGTNTYGYVLDMAREFDESGAVINTTDAKNGVTTFFYDAAHSPVKLVDAENGITTANYNDVGHRTSVNDPNRGVWNYQYNGFGELKKQIDARALPLNQNFDALGRMTSRSWSQPDRLSSVAVSFNDTFAYNNDRTSGHYGTLNHTQRLGEGSVREEYLYDALNRPMQKNYVGNSVAGRNWILTETTRYDPNFGRPVRKNFPAVAGADAQKIYMGYTLGGDPMQTGFDNRYLSSDPRSSNPTRYLRRDEGANARGQMLSSRFGSGDNSQAYQWLVSEYDASTGWLLSRCSGLTICSGVAQSAMAGGHAIDTNATMKLGYEYDYFGNVSKSVNVGRRPMNVTGDVRQETFGYDQLHRMVDATRMGAGVSTAQVTYGYSAVGNLLNKSDFGVNYRYQSPGHKHAVSEVTLMSGVKMNYLYDLNGNVFARYPEGGASSVFGYDIDNRPQWTNTTDSGSYTRIDFYLSASGAKALQVVTAGAQPRVVLYAGAYEAEYTNGVLSASRTYLAEGVLHNGWGEQSGLSFMHQDRLGSALVITDKGGLVLGADDGQAEFRTFDAFGKARDNQGLDGLGGRLFASNPNGKRNRKGFTGHEHLDEAGLIHMNGRSYDYNLGRFYGVDPIIQFPTNSQSLNGYSYLMNNPLAGTDPTGYASLCDSVSVNCDRVQGGISQNDRNIAIADAAGRSAQNQLAAKWNGAPQTQGVTPKAQTDGSKGGASRVADKSNPPTLDAIVVTAPRRRDNPSSTLEFDIRNILLDLDRYVSANTDAERLAARDDWDEDYSYFQGSNHEVEYYHDHGFYTAEPLLGGMMGFIALMPMEPAGLALGAVGIFGSTSKSETFYRAMSMREYSKLVRTGAIQASETGETMIAQSLTYAAKYRNVLVQFKAQSGTLQKLEAIGVRDASKLTSKFLNMESVNGVRWMATRAYFKSEAKGTALGIGLGNGRALEIFNEGILGFTRMR